VSRLVDPITAFLVVVLQALHQWTGNYGWAIVLLTLLVKLVLHPLTRRQLRSMKEMQYLAPQIAVLREKYKQDPQRLNMEVMNLYRAHKVNPFGGCLPMLVQLPVLWALFFALQRSGVLTGASFYGIPLDQKPALVSVGVIFPILVAVTTYLQQRLSVTDPQQARMFLFMPLLVGYFALNFAVGLSIYWIVSTLAYMLEYYIVVGRLAPPAPAAPISEEKPAVQVLPQRPKGTKKK